jgi:uncharacterized protein YgiM (DUF1202 family)
MTRLCIATLLAIAVYVGSPIAPTTAAPAERELVVAVDKAGVRKVPHIEYRILETLARGTIVREADRVGTWIQVRYARERIGWMAAADLVIAKQSDNSIAALLILASRQGYYAKGRPCACPEDQTQNGQRCGARSAYSRAGGAEPFCYSADVPAERIDEHRQELGATH